LEKYLFFEVAGAQNQTTNFTPNEIKFVYVLRTNCGHEKIATVLKLEWLSQNKIIISPF